MPFKSKAQARWMFANDKDMAAKWVREHGMPNTLPEYAKTGKFAKKKSKHIMPEHPSMKKGK